MSPALSAATSALTAASGVGNACCMTASPADANGVTNSHADRNIERASERLTLIVVISFAIKIPHLPFFPPPRFPPPPFPPPPPRLALPPPPPPLPRPPAG